MQFFLLPISCSLLGEKFFNNFYAFGIYPVEAFTNSVDGSLGQISLIVRKKLVNVLSVAK